MNETTPKTKQDWLPILLGRLERAAKAYGTLGDAATEDELAVNEVRLKIEEDLRQRGVQTWEPTR